jgi:hypothetical protein
MEEMEARAEITAACRLRIQSVLSIEIHLALQAGAQEVSQSSAACAGTQVMDRA